MNKLVESLKNTKVTENGALSYSSTYNPVLDLFSLGGSYRSRSDQDVYDLVTKAYDFDPTLTMKCLFYLRDVRGGQGERRFFRLAIRRLLEIRVQEYEEKVYYINLIPEYGRWDDLIYLLNSTDFSTLMIVSKIISDQFYKDIQAMNSNDSISLLGKWLPSENTSSKSTVRLAKKVRKILGLNSKDYRKSLSKLRSYSKVTETYTCSNRWSDIQYDQVPSLSMLKHRNSFLNHDKDRYIEYLNSVEKGTTKINTSTLYPSDIIEKVRITSDPDKLRTLEIMWDNLPNNISEKNKNSLCLIDTSGSMSLGTGSPRPISVAISLGIYFSQYCEGEFKDSFITFETNPHFIDLSDCKSLSSKVRKIYRAPWDGCTNLNRAFKLILNRAIANNVPESDMPKILYIISDMEFNGSVDYTNYETIKSMYKENGYELPRIVFWNVNARNNTIPSMNNKGVSLVSGYSSSTFNFVVDGGTPYEYMMSVLNSDRYKNIDYKLCSKLDN